jgi:prepilin signal peptidase PulO-like enzyme (type II secretory pathway)
VTRVAGSPTELPLGLILAITAASGATAAWWPRVAYRLAVAQGESPRTACSMCGTPFIVGWRGWFQFAASCGACTDRRWPVSLLAAILSAALCWRTADAGGGSTALMTGWLLIVQVGILLSLIDLAVRRLPTRLVGVLAAIVIVCAGFAAWLEGQPQLLLATVAGGLVVGALYLLLALVTPSQVGMGDVRLAATMGAALAASGWQAVALGLMLPYLLAFPFAVAQLRRRTARAEQLPFGPFLIAGALLAHLLASG